MDIFLTEEELAGEKSLFAPHEALYRRLVERTGDLRSVAPAGAENPADGEESPENDQPDSSQMGPPPVAC